MGEVERVFVGLESSTGRRSGAGGYPCQGLYYSTPDDKPRVALIATHYEIDFSQHYLAELVAERGLGFLGWNTRFRGAGSYFLLGPALDDIAAGVRWLREEAGAETVVLLGNSGGASLMAAYQSKATQPGTNNPRADLFISLNAHLGRPEVLTAWLDPSVTDESDPISRDPALDMFGGANGPPYTPEFQDRYRRAQVDRNHRITAWARQELERLEHDRLFNVYRTWADLRFLDTSIDPSDREAGCYLGDPEHANRTPFGLASTCTLRTWLEMWSLEESGCRAAPHLDRITCPSLVVQSTADQGCFPSDARAIYDGLAAADKTLEWLPGDHYFLDTPQGRPRVADLVGRWINERAP